MLEQAMITGPWGQAADPLGTGATANIPQAAIDYVLGSYVDRTNTAEGSIAPGVPVTLAATAESSVLNAMALNATYLVSSRAPA